MDGVKFGVEKAIKAIASLKKGRVKTIKQPRPQMLTPTPEKAHVINEEKLVVDKLELLSHYFRAYHNL